MGLPQTIHAFRSRAYLPPTASHAGKPPSSTCTASCPKVLNVHQQRGALKEPFLAYTTIVSLLDSPRSDAFEENTSSEGILHVARGKVGYSSSRTRVGQGVDYWRLSVGGGLKSAVCCLSASTGHGVLYHRQRFGQEMPSEVPTNRDHSMSGASGTSPETVEEGCTQTLERKQHRPLFPYIHKLLQRNASTI